MTKITKFLYINLDPIFVTHFTIGIQPKINKIHTSEAQQRWSRSRSAGVDSGRSLNFRLEQGPEPESILRSVQGGRPQMTSHYLGQKSPPSPPCHISSQVFKPPSNITSQFEPPPRYICNYKFPSILCLTRQKFHLFCRFDLCTLWQDQHSIRKTSKILHTLLSKN